MLLVSGCGMEIPDSAKNILSGSSHVVAGAAVDVTGGYLTPGASGGAVGQSAINMAFLAPRTPGVGVIPSQCFVLSNMFGAEL